METDLQHTRPEGPVFFCYSHTEVFGNGLEGRNITYPSIHGGVFGGRGIRLFVFLLGSETVVLFVLAHKCLRLVARGSARRVLRRF